MPTWYQIFGRAPSNRKQHVIQTLWIVMIYQWTREEGQVQAMSHVIYEPCRQVESPRCINIATSKQVPIGDL